MLVGEGMVVEVLSDDGPMLVEASAIRQCIDAWLERPSDYQGSVDLYEVSMVAGDFSRCIGDGTLDPSSYSRSLDLVISRFLSDGYDDAHIAAFRGYLRGRVDAIVAGVFPHEYAKMVRAARDQRDRAVERSLRNWSTPRRWLSSVL